MVGVAAALMLATAANGGGISGCRCPGSIGASGGAPPLVIVDDGQERPALIACGYLEERGPGDRVTASEFEVFRCGSEEALLTFGARHTCVLETAPAMLVITEVSRWPFGPGWSWVSVPVREFTVPAEDDRPIGRRMILAPPELDAHQVEQTLRDYVAARQERKAPEGSSERVARLEILIGRVLAVALVGNAEARRDLREMKDELRLDGALAEEQADAVRLYESYARETGAVPLR